MLLIIINFPIIDINIIAKDLGLFEKNENTDLSRFQILGEIQYSFKKGMSLVCGLTQDIPKEKPFNFETASVFITIALNRPLNWTF